MSGRRAQQWKSNFGFLASCFVYVVGDVCVETIWRAWLVKEMSLNTIDIPRKNARLRRGGDDEASLREAYAAHGPELFRFASRSLRDSRLAEDVVQETFVRAWRSRGCFDAGRASRRTWLFTIARNLIVDAARYRSTRPSVVRERGGEAHGSEDPTESALVSMHVKDALRSMSEEHRRVIFEVHYRDRPYKEVADELGVNPATLRTRMYYALRSLRANLEDMGSPASRSGGGETRQA